MAAPSKASVPMTCKGPPFGLPRFSVAFCCADSISPSTSCFENWLKSVVQGLVITRTKSVTSHHRAQQIAGTRGAQLKFKDHFSELFYYLKACTLLSLLWDPSLCFLTPLLLAADLTLGYTAAELTLGRGNQNPRKELAELSGPQQHLEYLRVAFRENWGCSENEAFIYSEID